MSHALIVEDDAETASAMATLVAAEKFTVATASSLRDARRQIALQPPDIVLLDLQLPDGSGLALFEEPRPLAQAQVVLITGHASIETSVQALRLGAADYLLKPVNLTRLRAILSRVMRPAELSAEIDKLGSELDQFGHFGPLWGRSAPMRRMYAQIARVAGTAVTVLITGESGTGKEVVARTVHDLSRRRAKPFLAVNCGAISPHLIESEIFGHEKGSFTGAERQHQGFFERAGGGTLFLDEITEMPLDLQVKLLRVLETGSFTRVGSTQSIEADVRVVAATNRDPARAMRAGKLRDDLYYRLAVFPIALPALRDRREDIPLLAEHFLAGICTREGERKRFDADCLKTLAERPWPGNVRELRNVVQRAYVMSPSERIREDAVAQDADSVAPAPAPAPSHSFIPARDGESAHESFPSITVAIGSSIAEAERQLILATLAHFKNHRERAAAVLGMSLKTLYNRLKEYGQEKLQPAEAAEAVTGPVPL